MVSNRGWPRSPNAKSPWQQLTSRANERVTQTTVTVLERAEYIITSNTYSQSKEQLRWLPITPRSHSQCPYHQRKQQVPPRPEQHGPSHRCSRVSGYSSPHERTSSRIKIKSSSSIKIIPLELVTQSSRNFSQPFSCLGLVSGHKLS